VQGQHNHSKPPKSAKQRGSSSKQQVGGSWVAALRSNLLRACLLLRPALLPSQPTGDLVLKGTIHRTPNALPDCRGWPLAPICAHRRSTHKHTHTHTKITDSQNTLRSPCTLQSLAPAPRPLSSNSNASTHGNAQAMTHVAPAHFAGACARACAFARVCNGVWA